MIKDNIEEGSDGGDGYENVKWTDLELYLVGLKTCIDKDLLDICS